MNRAGFHGESVVWVTGGGLMVGGFVVGGGDSSVEAAVVPVDVFEGGEGGVVEVSPGSPLAD